VAQFVSEDPRDYHRVEPSATLTKTWRIKNAGSTTWNGAYRFRHVKGALGTSRQDRHLTATVRPGETLTFAVPMRAPGASGTHREDWQLVSPSGQVVKIGGSRVIYAIIDVVK